MHVVVFWININIRIDPYSKVGKCFLEHADSMRTAYTQYCLNHDKAEQLLEKFDGLPEMQKVSFRVSYIHPFPLSLDCCTFRCYSKVWRV